MRNVRCPRCKSEHRLPNDATGYTCSGCGTEWVFAKCAQCHSTFHAPARTASWTCKRCGFRNVMEPPPEPEPEPEREKGSGVLQRASARWKAMSSRAKTGLVVVPLVVAALVIVIVLVSGGGGGLSPAEQLTAAKQSYCTHLRELTQEQRGPAVNRAAKKIKKDAREFRRAGDPATARELIAVVHAAKQVVAALENNKNPAAPAAAMQKAIGKAPSC